MKKFWVLLGGVAPNFSSGERFYLFSYGSLGLLVVWAAFDEFNGTHNGLMMWKVLWGNVRLARVSLFMLCPSAYMNQALRATSHMSQGPWPCNCESHQLSSKGQTNYINWHGLSKFALGLPLGGGPDTNSSKPWNIICNLPCTDPCRILIHDNFFESSSLPLLVRSELK